MCGIAGYITKNNSITESELREMSGALQHRGPNAEGFFINENIGLAHRRLSIIDLSTNANQPLFSISGKHVIVYNGEIYNYSEIAAELKQNFNINFRTSSDTEVILEAYEHLGPSCISKFNGMFAFAILNIETKELCVARDRVGIKPLYFFNDENNFAFASELKALKKIKSFPFEISSHSIYKFLHLGFIPAPHSIYKHVHKMESGTYMVFKNGTLEKHKYWDLFGEIKSEVLSNEKEALVKLSHLIMSSVQYQLKSDVPFGVFLSGGIDSSLITANAVNLAGVKVNTFSIGFEENKFNESIYAKAIAQFLGTNHHEFIVSYKNAIELIDTIFDAYSEPFADSSAIPTILVSKLAKQHVSVTLSGEGGDELFMGYGSYKWAQRLNNPFINVFRKSIRNSLQNLSGKYSRYANYFDYPDKFLIYSHILSQEQYLFSLFELKNVLSKDFWNKHPKIYLENLNDFHFEMEKVKRKTSAAEKQSFFDLKYYLQDDLLSKVDRASMQFSLETRVPYLDHRIIEFSMNLSPELKYKNGAHKYLLKEILFQYIPQKFFNRPKQGFAIPLEKWLYNDLSFLIDDYLNEEQVKKHGILNPLKVNQIVQEFRLEKKTYLYNRIWVMLMLQKWLSVNH